MLVHRDLGVISSDLKCLLKTELEVLETKLKDSFSEPESEFCFAKQQCGSLGQFRSTAEEKRDWL